MGCAAAGAAACAAGKVAWATWHRGGVGPGRFLYNPTVGFFRFLYWASATR